MFALNIGLAVMNLLFVLLNLWLSTTGDNPAVQALNTGAAVICTIFFAFHVAMAILNRNE